jgi:hypothetical protein
VVRQDASVAGTRGQVRPEPGERGLASHQPADVAALLEPAWAAVERVAEVVDLDAGTRLPGWSARQVLVHLGSWDDPDVDDSLAHKVAEARSGLIERAESSDARNARLVATHHDASREEVLAALRRARRSTSAFLLGEDVAQTGTAMVSSVVGEVPLTGLLVARAYELAVHALDLGPAGAGPPDEALLTAGLAALVDVTGALVARRELRAGFAVVTPVCGWLAGASDGDWTTVRLERGRSLRSVRAPGVEGSAADVLDASAGRLPAATALLSRRLRVHDVPALLQVLPAVEDAPGVPAGAAVRTAARALAGAGRAVGGLSAMLPGR